MSMAQEIYPHEEHGDFCFYSRPNCSLTQGERKKVFWGIAAVTLLIATAFSWLGYWLILPFAGLEIGVLAWAFDALGRRADDYESLCICGDEILIERRQGKHLERRALNCQWAKLVLVGSRPGCKVRLALRSYGQETELGAYLTDEARLELAKALQTWLKTG
jgi:Integral membrane protein